MTIVTALHGHTSQETAFLVEDYPYGFTLRCKYRCWIEHKPSYGYRFVSQTTNPKKSFEYWNKPKAGQYSKVAMGMYLDEKGHVQHTVIQAHDLTSVAGFIEHWHDRSTMLEVLALVMAADSYNRKAAASHAEGLSAWTINGQAQPVSLHELDSNKKDRDVLDSLIPIVNKYAEPHGLRVKERTK